jgi:hypothetical protein
MLKCVYHPIDNVRVVEDDEADKLMATGVWFDTPTKAKTYREKVEDEIKQESKVDDLGVRKPKVLQPKTKLKGK